MKNAIGIKQLLLAYEIASSVCRNGKPAKTNKRLPSFSQQANKNERHLAKLDYVAVCSFIHLFVIAHVLQILTFVRKSYSNASIEFEEEPASNAEVESRRSSGVLVTPPSSNLENQY